MRLCLMTVVGTFMFLAGCGPDSRDVKSRSRAYRICVAIDKYGDQYGKCPTSLEELSPRFLSQRDFRVAMTNPRTGESPAWEYVRPANRLIDVERPAETAMLFELEGGKRKTGGFVGYADTHVEPELGTPLTPDDLKLPE